MGELALWLWRLAKFTCDMWQKTLKVTYNKWYVTFFHFLFSFCLCLSVLVSMLVSAQIKRLSVSSIHNFWCFDHGLFPERQAIVICPSVHRFNQHLTGPYYIQPFHKATHLSIRPPTMATALWSLQIVAHGFHQEISRNFKGIGYSATPKQFYSPILKNQFCIKKKKTKKGLIIRL